MPEGERWREAPEGEKVAFVLSSLPHPPAAGAPSQRELKRALLFRESSLAYPLSLKPYSCSLSGRFSTVMPSMRTQRLLRSIIGTSWSNAARSP